MSLCTREDVIETEIEEKGRVIHPEKAFSPGADESAKGTFGQGGHVFERASHEVLVALHQS